MNGNNDLEQLRKQEYQQQTIVNRLRREVFGQADPTASENLVAELLSALSARVPDGTAPSLPNSTSKRTTTFSRACVR